MTILLFISLFSFGSFLFFFALSEKNFFMGIVAKKLIYG